MPKKMMIGSGLCECRFDREGERIAFDFLGQGDDGYCYRNDAAIYFFAANSYKSAFLCIDNELNQRFKKIHTKK